ncbi:MAG TPA: class I tRNA ligase family protein, partial [Alphaproteobacteria bacterium]|nr:class I tRNA ligase family protein [Alphaproteobacteria bacterium]
KMSKSKKNVVDPEDILGTYGADAARLFILSDSPPERDLEWTESGIEGAWRYINKLHIMAGDTLAQTSTQRDESLTRLTHKTIIAVSEDIEAFRMNKAVARIREFSNAIEKSLKDGADVREPIQTLIQLISPMIPHLAEELWSMMGHKTLLANAPWPKADASLLTEGSVTIGVQVNGKMRATITLAPNASEEDAKTAALGQDNVQKAMEGLKLRKFIYVPGKIVNVVAG